MDEIVWILLLITFVMNYTGYLEYLLFISCEPWYYRCGPVLRKSIFTTQLTGEQVLMRLRDVLESGELAGAIKDREVLVRLHGVIGWGREYSRVWISFFAFKVRITIQDTQVASRVIVESRPFIVGLIVLPLYFLLGLSFAVLDSSVLFFCGFCLGYVLFVRATYLESAGQRKQFFSILREQLLAESAEVGIAKKDAGPWVYSYRIGRPRDVWWFIGALFFFVALSALTMILPAEHAPSARDLLVFILGGLGCSLTMFFVQRRVGSIRILTDEHRIIYESRRKVIRVSWSDVTDFYDKEGLISTSIVETAHGRFRIFSLLRGYEKLKREIKEKATRSRSRQWKKR